ncbi:hypothetical protein AU79_22270 [Salmonella enterica subsp. enterica serovar Enteritidis str. SA19940857]|nr:hypothetical protein AU79_22270 [Salmonella enterica subsp. enterica serovar Enteritidis str. SA19940857]
MFKPSGHRGSAGRHSFNEPHILAIAQAIAEERAKNGITGPCYVGKDTHALSEPAFISVLEVLAANGVDVIVQENNGFTPTPAVSNAILVHNKKGFIADPGGVKQDVVAQMTNFIDDLTGVINGTVVGA